MWSTCLCFFFPSTQLWKKIFNNINVVRPPCFLRGVSTTDNFGCFYLSASESPSIKLQGQRAKGTLIISMEAKTTAFGTMGTLLVFFFSVPFSPGLLRTDSERDCQQCNSIVIITMIIVSVQMLYSDYLLCNLCFHPLLSTNFNYFCSLTLD